MNYNDHTSGTQMVVTLPDHLIVQQILPRLPVKSLIRFKSVCRSWSIAISSREFVKFHLQFSSSRPQFLILAHESESHAYIFYLLAYDLCCSNVKTIAPNTNLDYVCGTMNIVGSCDGLLCLYREDNQHHSFFLWNPAIHLCRELDQISELEAIEPFMFTAAYGFGYSSSIDDYKIAAFFTSYNDDEFVSHFYVFSMRSKTWKRIPCDLDKFRVSTIGVRKAVLINDVLYWPLRNRNHEGWSKHIVGFNLGSEQLGFNPWMSWLQQGSDVNLPLYSMKGCLSLSSYTDDNRVDVWMLKNNGDWNSWEKLFFVNLNRVDYIHFSKTGKCLIQHSQRLKLVDQTQEALQHMERDSEFDGYYIGHVWEVEDYADSLVSPF